MRNKRLRHEIKFRKYQRRLKLYGFDKLPTDIIEKTTTNVLRTTSRPCNCWMCKGKRYNRAAKHKKVVADLINEIKLTT